MSTNFYTDLEDVSTNTLREAAALDGSIHDQAGCEVVFHFGDDRAVGDRGFIAEMIRHLDETDDEGNTHAITLLSPSHGGFSEWQGGEWGRFGEDGDSDPRTLANPYTFEDILAELAQRHKAGEAA